MEPYLVCVFLQPTKKAAEEGEIAKVIVKQETVLAKDQNQAAVKAMKLVPPEYDGQEERCEVRVLPFQKPCK